ncbi:MAG: hypothetical protein GY702_26370 [Desulfobulbaceae bacterium]|nr:hypothetical protein [Desulfobulbaceae bacterium]
MRMKRAFKGRRALPIRIDEPMEVDNLYNFNAMQSQLTSMNKRMKNLENPSQNVTRPPPLLPTPTQGPVPANSTNANARTSTGYRGKGGRGKKPAYTPRQPDANAPFTYQNAATGHNTFDGKHNGKTCYNCGSPHHFAKFCPNKHVNNNVMGATNGGY